MQSAFILDRIPYTKLKRYPSNVLANLSDERKATLHEWLKNSIPYRQIVQRMAKEWNVKTHIHSLSVYYRRIFADEIIEQRSKTADVTETLNKAITRKPADYAKAILDTLGRKSVELSNNATAHPKIVRYWIDMYAKLEELELRKRIIRVKEQRIKLLKKQADQARATAMNSKLNPEEQATRMREIFSLSLDQAQTGGNGFKDGG